MLKFTVNVPEAVTNYKDVILAEGTGSLLDESGKPLFDYDIMGNGSTKRHVRPTRAVITIHESDAYAAHTGKDPTSMVGKAARQADIEIFGHEATNDGEKEVLSDEMVVQRSAINWGPDTDRRSGLGTGLSVINFINGLPLYHSNQESIEYNQSQDDMHQALKRSIRIAFTTPASGRTIEQVNEFLKLLPVQSAESIEKLEERGREARAKFRGTNAIGSNPVATAAPPASTVVVAEEI